MTTFINLTIQKNIKAQCRKTGMYWFEVDNKRDLKFAAKSLKRLIIFDICLLLSF